MLFLGLLLNAGCHSMFLATATEEAQTSSIDEAEEIEIAADSFHAIISQESRSENAHLEQMVVRVGHRLAEVSERPDYQWKFHLFDGARQHAFCLPGGLTAVYEGILPVCESEGGIAALISHEIAHVLSRHGAERLAAMPHQEENERLVDRLFRHRRVESLSQIRIAYGVGHSADGPPLPFSRSQEAEADSIGLLLMARAGYDPQETPRFWSRLSHQTGIRASGAKTADLLVVHPLDDVRLRRMRDIIPQALSVYQGAPQRFGLGERIPMQAIASVPLQPQLTIAETVPSPPAVTSTSATPPLPAAAAAPTSAAVPSKATVSTAVVAIPTDQISASDVVGAPTVEGASASATASIGSPAQPASSPGPPASEQKIAEKAPPGTGQESTTADQKTEIDVPAGIKTTSHAEAASTVWTTTDPAPAATLSAGKNLSEALPPELDESNGQTPTEDD